MILTALLTVYLGWQSRKLEMFYEYATILPKDDQDLIDYLAFKKTFGEDGNILVVGFDNENLYKINNFVKYQKFCAEIAQIPGVNEVIALPTLKKLIKDTLQDKFVLKQVFESKVQYKRELDSLLNEARNIEFYKGLVYSDSGYATLAAVYLNKNFLNSPKRKALVGGLLEMIDAFEQSTGIDAHVAGLPYTRYIMISAFQDEFKFLLIMSALVTCVILFVFFRSFYAVFFTLLVIIITVIWTMGLTALLGYKISLLTGMLPALIVIISIPTCIYMFNKYHQEYRRHRNKIKAIARIIQKIGFITFMTNANTAVGFFVLLITDITVIKEFGLVAGIMSLATFIITLVVIPALFIYLPQPSEKQMMHLDKKMLTQINLWVTHVVMRYRTWVYVTTVVVTLLGIAGIFRLQPVGYMVDDMPEKSNVIADLHFFEQHFRGVMPLEILIDMGKKKAAFKIQNLQLMDRFQDNLAMMPEISPSISVISIVKSATKAFYNDAQGSYRLPTNSEKNFILRYFSRKNEELGILRSFVDSNAQVARISLKVKDLGTLKMSDLLYNKVQRAIDSVFKETDFSVKLTGTSPLFLKGNLYLLSDLTQSMLMAFALISLMMAFIFTDIRMILISLIPNAIPLIMTAGLMGWLDIRMKLSTAIIFSLSFGITIDATIHYLSKFKQELEHGTTHIPFAVVKSLRDSGVSMLYTGLVLIFGFSIFILSDFGGTVALGTLTCLTLFFSLLTNLILLPALLITFIKNKVK